MSPFQQKYQTTRNEISNNFATCDCGRNCLSDLGYCIKVYVSVVGDNSTSLMGDIVQSHFTSHCTFEETNCFNGESLSDRNSGIRHSK